MSEIISAMPWLSHYSVVFMTALFLVIVAGTYWPGQKSRIEGRGRIPLKDDV